VDEALRLIDAFQFVEKYGEVCPANWQAGQEGIKADIAGSKRPQEKKSGEVTMVNGSIGASVQIAKPLKSIFSSH
jgi:peroxiredoxin (alkyl hydroperoxide reductase subunit C)